jgi:hypothetical protein
LPKNSYSRNTTKRDEYFTPIETINLCLDKIPADIFSKPLIDPAAGDGRWTKEILKRYPKADIISIDIQPLDPIVEKADALQYDWNNRIAIGNPPFSLWRQFIKKTNQLYFILPAIAIKRCNRIEKAWLYKDKFVLDFECNSNIKHVFAAFFELNDQIHLWDIEYRHMYHPTPINKYESLQAYKLDHNNWIGWKRVWPNAVVKMPISFVDELI